MKVLGNTLCPYMCWAKGKLLYESTVIQREASIYMQIRNTGFEKECRWSERSTVRGAKGCTRRYQSWCDGSEAPKDWLAAGQSITVEGCGLLCVLLRLHSV